MPSALVRDFKLCLVVQGPDVKRSSKLGISLALCLSVLATVLIARWPFTVFILQENKKGCKALFSLIKVGGLLASSLPPALTSVLSWTVKKKIKLYT